MAQNKLIVHILNNLETVDEDEPRTPDEEDKQQRENKRANQVRKRGYKKNHKQ